MDELAPVSELGMASMVPEGMAPGSDTANLSVMGYDPRIYYTGRSPLEALSIGVAMEESDVSFRCNLVTLSEEDVPYGERTILDHSSDEIATEGCGGASGSTGTGPEAGGVLLLCGNQLPAPSDLEGRQDPGSDAAP